jgi:hypothetical protein
LDTRLACFPAVALLGPRQVGKTTLALQLAASRASVSLHLEAPCDQARLSDPALHLASQADKPVDLVLDLPAGQRWAMQGLGAELQSRATEPSHRTESQTGATGASSRGHSYTSHPSRSERCRQRLIPARRAG